MPDLLTRLLILLKGPFDARAGALDITAWLLGAYILLSLPGDMFLGTGSTLISFPCLAPILLVLVIVVLLTTPRV
jgi:hypothetical protein